MAQTMRGMRLGSQSLENERGVVPSARVTALFRCPAGHDNELVFSADAELPISWDCKHCAQTAFRMDAGEFVERPDASTDGPRTHYQMLLERRTREELEELLQERLEVMRSRRARGQADV